MVHQLSVRSPDLRRGHNHRTGLLPRPRDPAYGPGSRECDPRGFDGADQGPGPASPVAEIERPVPERDEDDREYGAHVCEVCVHGSE